MVEGTTTTSAAPLAVSCLAEPSVRAYTAHRLPGEASSSARQAVSAAVRETADDGRSSASGANTSRCAARARFRTRATCAGWSEPGRTTSALTPCVRSRRARRGPSIR